MAGHSTAHHKSHLLSEAFFWCSRCCSLNSFLSRSDYFFTVVVEMDNIPSYLCNGSIPSFLLLFFFLLLIVEVAMTVVNEMQSMIPLGTVHMQFPAKFERSSKMFYKHDIAKGLSFPLVKFFCHFAFWFSLKKIKSRPIANS